MQGLKPWERIDRDVSSRYKVGRRIGRGCYGVVWEVTTKDSSAKSFALKKVLNAFRNDSDAQRTYREIVYLIEFGHHDNVLRLHDVLVSANDKHLYIVADLLGSDLSKAMKCQVLEPVHHILISYQMLRALKYIHSASVMHRDIKPSNILLDQTCKVVLADFGWARASPMMNDSLASGMTEYASARWYRAPEMLLGARWYTTAIDMWAFACVVAEMHTEAPLVMGTSTLDMLSKIEEMLGKPSSHDVEMMDAPYAPLALPCMMDGPPHIPLEALLPGVGNELLVDFVKLLLQYNPMKRMSASEALSHPFVGPFHDPDGEPSFEGRAHVSLRDDVRLPAFRYRDQIYAEIFEFSNAKRRLEDEERQRLPSNEFSV